jgi:hypothetical protein
MRAETLWQASNNTLPMTHQFRFLLAIIHDIPRTQDDRIHLVRLHPRPMKISALLLFASLTANAALFAVFAFKSSSASSATAKYAVATKAEANGSSATKTSESVGAANLPATTWSTLQNSDLATLVARLRAAGFPSYVIRRIVSDQLGQEFAKRYADLMKQLFDRPFWKNANGVSFDPKIMTAMRAASKEYSDTLKSLVGEDPGADDPLNTYQKRRYGDLPKAKIEQLQAIESDYSDLSMQVQGAARGMILPEDQEKLALLEKEKRADLVKLLTPEELEEYDLRSSTSANTLRSTLATFNPTEAEYRALFKLQSALDEQYPMPTGGMITSEQMAPRQAAEKQLQPQIQALLGPDRYADYQLATDPKYQQVNRLVARLELPASTSVEVVNVQENIQKQAMALRQDGTLTPDQRNAQLAALAQQAQTQLTATLGLRGYEAYKDNGGYWLQNLQPRPAATIRKVP